VPLFGMTGSGSVLCVGSATLDFIFGVDCIPAGAVKHRAKRFEMAGGGNAATAAVTIARLGGRATLVGRIGDDIAGEVIRRDLEAAGVAADLLQVCPGTTSSVSSIVVDGQGERLILNYTDLSAPEDAAAFPGLPADVSVVLGDSKWPAATRHLFKAANARHLAAVLDADMPDLPHELIRIATHAAFSRSGLEIASGCNSVETGLRSLSRLGSAVLIVTDGAEGLFWLEDGVCHHMAAFAVKPVDTLGAGDVFHGAFALALAEKQPLREALCFASAAAAVKVTRFGGRKGCPTRSEVAALMRA